MIVKQKVLTKQLSRGAFGGQTVDRGHSYIVPIDGDNQR